MLQRARALPLWSTLVLLGALFYRDPGTAQDAASAEFLALPALAGTRGGSLVSSINGDPRTFNHLLAHEILSTTVSDLISADLVHVDRATLKLEPALARDWEVSQDRRSYTLHLRRGLRFSDGAPFGADDVLFSFQVVADPRVPSSSGDQLRVDGVFPALAGVDSHTVRVTFPRPTGAGLRVLDSVVILPRHRLEKPYREGRLPSAWGPETSPSEIAGMGPFRLREYQPGVKIVLERNPYYWKKDKSGQVLPYLDTVTLLIIPDRTAEALRFQTGDTDVLNSIDPESFAALKRAEAGGKFTIHDLGPGLDYDFIAFNLNPGRGASGKPHVDPRKQALFEKQQFRRAVSHALNRAGIARTVLLGLGAPQYGPVTPGNKGWYHPSPDPPEYNPARARERLASLGLRDADGNGVLDLAPGRDLEITLLTTRGTARHERTAEIVKDNLSKVGVRVVTQSVDLRDLVQRVTASFDYEAFLMGFTPTDPEPDALTDVWYSGGSDHFWHPGQPRPARAWEAEIDRLVSQLVRSTDGTERRKLFAEVQGIWVREMPIIPTVSRNILAAWKTKVSNIRPSVRQPHLIWNAEELWLAGR